MHWGPAARLYVRHHGEALARASQWKMKTIVALHRLLLAPFKHRHPSKDSACPIPSLLSFQNVWLHWSPCVIHSAKIFSYIYIYAPNYKAISNKNMEAKQKRIISKHLASLMSMCHSFCQNLFICLLPTTRQQQVKTCKQAKKVDIWGGW